MTALRMDAIDARQRRDDYTPTGARLDAGEWVVVGVLIAIALVALVVGATRSAWFRFDKLRLQPDMLYKSTKGTGALPGSPLCFLRCVSMLSGGSCTPCSTRVCIGRPT
jgi:hypothetical protein